MPSIRLHLLSGFELDLGDEFVEIQPSGQRLLAFVALAPHGVQRNFAAFQLWPDGDEDRARANLRTALWRLGQVSPDLVTATRTSLRLGREVWVDARDGLAEMGTSDSGSGAATRPFDALAGDLLPDWYDDWLVVERERVRQLRLRMLEDRTRRLLDDGDVAAAIQTGLAALSIDPCRETGSRLLIEAHLAEGNACEARREFERLERTIHDDYGLAPSAELRSLVSAV